MTTPRTARVAHPVRHPPTRSPPVRHPPVRIPQPIRALGYDAMEAFEERAAIMEYEGGLSRAEAEARAAEMVMRSKGVRR